MATGFSDVVYEVEWFLIATEGSDSVTLTGSTQLALHPTLKMDLLILHSLTHDIVKGLDN